MRDWLKRIAESRFRISTRLYSGIGAAVVLTFAASLVGWFSINRVGDVQERVNEGSVPAMAVAFSVAQFSGELIAASPRIAAATPEDLDSVAASINETYAAFDSELVALETTAMRPGQNQLVRGLGVTLRSNIEEIKFDRLELFQLDGLKSDLQTQLDELRAEIDAALIPALDDQFFFLMTGYQDLGEPASSRAEHLSEEELRKFRFLSELQANANISTQLLASAFGLSDASTIEPLRERFEASSARIQRNISQLVESDPLLANEFDRLFERLFALGGEQGGFDLRESELRLLQSQEELLNRNRAVAADLLDNVNSLVGAAEASVQEATQASENAILTGQTLLLVISAISIVGGLLIIYQVGRVLLRRLARLSDWMRGMAKGNLELTADVGGRDEIADMGAAVEVFRQHALEVQRLNLVELLAEELQEKNEQLEDVLADLQRAQDQIVIREKLAALGELTAGVAHEIKNPLNFVKNFSEASEELIEELNEILEEIGDSISEEQKSWIAEIKGDLGDNLERIRSHGDRANRIVTDMLSMGRETGEWQMANINNLLEEHARLAYHSARATDSEFQLDLQPDLDEEVGELRVIPRDLGRVFLNMVGNACDATDEKRREIWGASEENEPYGESYSPTLWLRTQRTEDQVEIRIRDNGNGIPPDVADKIFNPFFTTKPTDRGTGLGLAISSDIVRQHGGTISVDSEIGEYTEMLITLPTELPEEPTPVPSQEVDAAAAT
ncbi:MAG: HAMP domain-containing protein [Acidimicrobiaceae bacterium]|nr:ATP-binding protein [Acidimicrobiaceae bacterium]MXW62657.1 HAMP domain-containing protein [Acidimicrobiaceae bacterium]MXW74787.1 HAMP domain-containing protein [Acidimicrobiaceae bacterium]MYA73428.1 HAMP domain-containing protein [Acidimicrobiaceae bacterium]MYC42020.1 HAMP domain-containing protein [Acidimicrobiaceae bacterium]